MPRMNALSHSNEITNTCSRALVISRSLAFAYRQPAPVNIPVSRERVKAVGPVAGGPCCRCFYGFQLAIFWRIWLLSSSIFTLVCSIESRSLRVTVPFSAVSESTVRQNGVPTSSMRR